ncbi:hypothetical protein CLIB1423_01S07030 [[Candida] railenensis]|uniref:Ada DNA repair metal-binding domain-containing protein n=1 Tax=[Candida] railenensis TaxID=45579 RepID=A0A9P0QKV4_9ASCO|nr:hypothetical protein CLIB1423_01S07030 [[Candida] railenensis]
MVYSTETAKWKAYQFSDPFAAGAFVVCNKISKSFCRPDCDARPITNLKAEIKFMSSANDALKHGYEACSHCDPINMQAIDVNLLINCVTTVNKQIGFLTPLMDENEDKNNERIKENILESKKIEEISRRSSVPVVSFDGKYSKDFENTSISKNDSDHYRLVDLACRHLALAAAANVFQQSLPKVPSSPEEVGASPGSKKRRRRGGVLGFKELAAKSKLSAWHFHRVFKSVTGLTPKTYGDKCSEYLNTINSSPNLLSVPTTSSAIGGSPVFRTPVSNIMESDSHPTSPEGSTASTIPTVFSDSKLSNNISNKRIKLDAKQNMNDNMYNTSVPLNDQSFQSFSSLNVFTPPMSSQDQIPQVPSQASFDMNFAPPQQATSDVPFGTNFDEGILNNYLNSFKSHNLPNDITSEPQLSFEQKQSPSTETNNLYGATSLFPPSNSNAYDGSPLSSIIPEDINTVNTDSINTDHLNFNFNDTGSQFLNTGYSDEFQFPIEEFPVELTNEIY